ncbi:MAG: hypothetical protein CVT59_11555 [Actinobacteria bacterium HGW-Actinobacteria-1]|jgi:glycosyltransferase involved in cell wall biosynthesis|nr:MAG: hypothetical protein CVT59_11555 [Actinobacteria bacterium HGW-Actinobacteria-1]
MEETVGVGTGGGAMSAAPRRMRVLVVSLGRRGGVNEYGWLMSRALADRFDIATITSAGAEGRERWATLEGPHLEVPTFSSVATLVGSFFVWARFARIRRFARSFGPDIVYYPGGHAWKPVLDLILPRNAKVVLTVHDPELHEGETSLAHRLLDKSNQLKVQGFVLLNEAQRAGFIARCGVDAAHVAVIPHGIFEDLKGREAPLLDVEGLHDVAPYSGAYALFIGRIERYKGIELLLSAYTRIASEAAFPLVLAGSGEFSAQETVLLRSLADRRIVVINRWLSDAEVAALVAAARFVVLPYTSGTQSGVIPLASTFGVPSIASDVGGITEQVIDGETGFLFAAGDSLRLTAVLNRAFAMNDSEYAVMSEQCARHAEEEWRWDALATRLGEFFKSLVG